MANRFASRIRVAVRVTGVASVFTLSALAGFGTEPPATRPSEIATGFVPRPFAMSYAVREAVAQARANQQFAGVIEAIEARPEPVPVPVVAYTATGETDSLDRFDAFVAGTLAFDAPDMPVPTMRPVGSEAERP